MRKPQSEDDKKHGDKLEQLIGRTGGSPHGKRDPNASSEDPAELQRDDEDLENDDADNSDGGDRH